MHWYTYQLRIAPAQRAHRNGGLSISRCAAVSLSRVIPGQSVQQRSLLCSEEYVDFIADAAEAKQSCTSLITPNDSSGGTSTCPSGFRIMASCTEAVADDVYEGSADATYVYSVQRAWVAPRHWKTVDHDCGCAPTAFSPVRDTPVSSLAPL